MIRDYPKLHLCTN